MYISTPPSPEVENFQIKIYYPTRDRTPDLLNQRQTCYHLSQCGERTIIVGLWIARMHHHRSKWNETKWIDEYGEMVEWVVVGLLVLDFTTLLISQVISVTYYSEHEKSDKFCSESLISSWGSLHDINLGTMRFCKLRWFFMMCHRPTASWLIIAFWTNCYNIFHWESNKRRPYTSSTVSF